MDRLKISLLRQDVSSKFGGRISTTADFNKLSEDIRNSIKETCSTSTLKRIWGYVGGNTEPRISTLDILSRYVGYDDFASYEATLAKTKLKSSGHFNAESIATSDLAIGETITIGWKPDRVVTISYLGNNRFKVTSSQNSQLQVEDEFEAASFLAGYPLYLSGIYRNGQKTAAYVAGRDGGIMLMAKA